MVLSFAELSSAVIGFRSKIGRDCIGTFVRSMPFPIMLHCHTEILNQWKDEVCCICSNFWFENQLMVNTPHCTYGRLWPQSFHRLQINTSNSLLSGSSDVIRFSYYEGEQINIPSSPNWKVKNWQRPSCWNWRNFGLFQLAITIVYKAAIHASTSVISGGHPFYPKSLNTRGCSFDTLYV